MPRCPSQYDLVVHLYIAKGDPLNDFIRENMLPGERPGQAVKRLLRELMSYKWYRENERRIKRSIKRQLKMRAGR